MPKYTYRCLMCHERFDVVHGMLEEAAGCPKCLHVHVKKVPHMPHVARKQTSKGERVGEETKRAIEENRALLREEKKKRVEYKDGD